MGNSTGAHEPSARWAGTSPLRGEEGEGGLAAMFPPTVDRIGVGEDHV